MKDRIHNLFHKQVLCRLGRHEPVEVIEDFDIVGFTYAELDRCELMGYKGKVKAECRWCRIEIGVAVKCLFIAR